MFRAQSAGVVLQRAADNLLHPAFMQVNAWTKHDAKLRRVGEARKRKLACDAKSLDGPA
jgi:hypothetical protein